MADIDRRPQNGLSEVFGPRDDPLLEVTIPQLLRQTVEKHPEQLAAVFAKQGIRRSYAAFQSDVDAIAAGFLALGLHKGDRLGIWSPNRYEWLLTQFATARIGVILVNINPAYRLRELDYALNKVDCKAVVTARRFKSSDYVGMLLTLKEQNKLPSVAHIICMGDDIPEGMLAFEDLARDATNLPPLNDLRPEEPINIQFTSGTTGQPKGATLTHRNIVNNAHFVTKAMAFTACDRLCIPVPFYHCFGMVMGTLGCVSKGAAMIVPSEGFDPKETLKALEAEDCTACYGVPTMFVTMLEHPDFDAFDLSSLRTGIMAGAPCPTEVMRQVQSKMHMSGVTIAYGMTETSPVSFQSGPDDPVERRVSSVGRIHPHVDVKIVGANDESVPVGTQGELWTKGYSVMQGYWGDAARTSEVIDTDGWMRTGDLATIDAEGFVKITGRLKDMIVRGGENIYPREIEEFLYIHPAISQVQVFGIPDETYGESVCAWIIPKPDAKTTETALRAFCQDQIAHYKIPARFCFVDDIPMTVTGKPQKFLMRRAMIEQLGLKEPETA